jgi:hypothetical protein
VALPGEGTGAAQSGPPGAVFPRPTRLPQQTAEKKSEAEREGRKRQRLEKEVRELKASLEARGTEARAKQVEILAAEEQVSSWKVLGGNGERRGVGTSVRIENPCCSMPAPYNRPPAGLRPPAVRHFALCEGAATLSPPFPSPSLPAPHPPPGRAPGGEHQGGARRDRQGAEGIQCAQREGGEAAPRPGGGGAPQQPAARGQRRAPGAWAHARSQCGQGLWLPSGWQLSRACTAVQSGARAWC